MSSISRKQKIVLIGGLGFIGTNLQYSLLTRGVAAKEIYIIDNASNPAQDPLDNDIEVLETDFANFEKIKSILARADVVIHLAAATRVQDSIQDPVFSFEQNVSRAFKLIELCRHVSVKKFVFASTGGAILGDALPPINESMVALPKSPYGASKAAIEAYLSAYHHSFGFNYLALRFSNIFGKFSKRKQSVVSAFIKQIEQTSSLTINGSGDQTRDFLFAEDLCDAILAAIRSDVTGVFQLGTGKGTSIRQLGALLIEISGKKVEILFKDGLPGEVNHTFCDISRAKQSFGFKPGTPLAMGLKETYYWHRNAC
ncbi:MAG: NAD-dependent epimerase/dehydratase family protein [Pseudomonadota bacterium]|nr:NAD-dependent epimerase/dehydratase family protein [Pseudomonadota bacterium]